VVAAIESRFADAFFCINDSDQRAGSPQTVKDLGAAMPSRHLRSMEFRFGSRTTQAGCWASRVAGASQRRGGDLLSEASDSANGS